MPLLRALVAATFMLLLTLPAVAWERGHVETFAVLPPSAAHPEGITADRHGNIYVTTFDVSKASGPGDLIVFGPHGGLIDHLSVAGSSNLLLGLAFHPITHVLLVIDFGHQQVLSVNPKTGAATVFTTIPGGAAAGPNGLTFDQAGNVYVSDSFQGTIWKTGLNGGPATAWVTDALLTTTGVPPFGANGLAFNSAGDSLFVCNTGNDSVVRVPVAGGGNASAPVAFAYSINGCDGLIIDDDDNLWLAANQADEIVVLNPQGRVIAKLGDFGGLDRHGAPIGLLFPASPVRHDGHIYITNLSLDLRLFGFPAADSQWAADVKRHTIARIPARIPRVPGLK